MPINKYVPYSRIRNRNYGFRKILCTCCQNQSAIMNARALGKDPALPMGKEKCPCPKRQPLQTRVYTATKEKKNQIHQGDCYWAKWESARQTLCDWFHQGARLMSCKSSQARSRRNHHEQSAEEVNISVPFRHMLLPSNQLTLAFASTAIYTFCQLHIYCLFARWLEFFL